MKSEVTKQDNRPCGNVELLETVLLALSVTGLWYYCYFLMAPWIWSQNIPFNRRDITPWIRCWTNEHDGVEIYALYILMFLNVFSAFIISSLIGLFTGKSIKRLILLLCAAGAIIYCATISFIPPMNTFTDTPISVVFQQSLVIMLVISLLVTFLCYLQLYCPRLAPVCAAIVLLPVCFLATSNISFRDYSYIFAPALRLLNGAALSDIYFQYEFFPSLLAAGWMKLGIDLNYFRILGQAAYYLLILSVFIFSGKLFLKKELAVFLLAALVLVRMYATPYDPTLDFQVTPLRLDLWLPLLLVVYRWGPFHWLTGLACGLLLLMYKNFGIIYSVAYVQLLLTLCAIDYFDSRGEMVRLWCTLTMYAKRCALPVTIMAVFFFASYFLFHNAEFGDYASYYQKIGIGFLPIARNSFYWYVPTLFSLAAILMFRLRKRVPSAYLSTGFMLLYLAIGNSIYFFGRSHESNIIMISLVLLFLFFFLMDLVARSLSEGVVATPTLRFMKQHAEIGLAVIFIVVIIVSYSGNITRVGATQIQNLADGKISYGPVVLPEGLLGNLEGIRKVTNGSSKLYFVDDADFAYYYYGGYALVGYCNPFPTWIFTSDLVNYMQKLLDSGYYLVINPKLTPVLANLRFDFNAVVGDKVIVAIQSNR